MASTNQTNQLQQMGIYHINNNDSLNSYSPKHCNKVNSSQVINFLFNILL
jgi:hypothetical protein